MTEERSGDGGDDDEDERKRKIRSLKKGVVEI